jgi:hypothetical protein
MFYQPLRMDDDIVIYDEKDFARGGTQSPVQRIRLTLPFLLQDPDGKSLCARRCLGKHTRRIVR